MEPFARIASAKITKAADALDRAAEAHDAAGDEDAANEARVISADLRQMAEGVLL